VTGDGNIPVFIEAASDKKSLEKKITKEKELIHKKVAKLFKYLNKINYIFSAKIIEYFFEIFN
jgi:hypothetical protein